MHWMLIVRAHARSRCRRELQPRRSRSAAMDRGIFRTGRLRPGTNWNGKPGYSSNCR